MSDNKPTQSNQGGIKGGGKDVRPADQAEGERGNETSTKVGKTPGSAEGERDTADQSDRKQGNKSNR